MGYKTFPWNSWLDFFDKGDVAPLLNGIRRIVRQGGRTNSCKRYGDDMLEETEQDVWVRITRYGVLQESKEQGWDDSKIQAAMYKIVHDAFLDILTKRKGKKNGEYKFFLLSETRKDADSDDETFIFDYLTDTRISQEEGFEIKQLLSAIWCRLSERQKIILENYDAFRIGYMSGEELAYSLNVSIQTINKDVGGIRSISKQVALDIKGRLPSDDSRARKKRVSKRNGKDITLSR